MIEPTTIAEQAIIPLPNGYSPEGVAETIIDPATIHLIEQTIPGGRELFAHLLYYATLDPRTAMQLSLFHATGEANNEAIVLISNVEALAKSANSPFRSPDAYSRRLVALESLKVIRRKLHRTFTEIRIPLGIRSIHVPSLLADLWKLHETYKDTKVKQLARKMAKQLKTGEFLAYASSTCMHVDEELVPVIHVLDSILQARGIKEEASILTEACGIIAQLLLPQKYGRVGDNIGEFLSALPKGDRTSAKKVGESVTHSGDFPSAVGARGEGRVASSSTQVGEFPTTNSPEFAGSKRKKHAFRVKAGEFQSLFTINSPEFGPFGRVPEEMGDSVVPVSISDHYFSNNITSKRTESLIDDNSNSDVKQGEVLPSVYRDTRPIEEIRHDARTYADLLDGVGNYRWMGKLVTCVQNHPSDICRLAVIDTLYHTAFPDWRRKPNAPGAWFCKAADRFDAPGAKVPNEVRLWAETDLPYHEIDEALQAGRRTPMDNLLPMMSSDDEQDVSGHETDLDDDSPREEREEHADLHGARTCSGLRTKMNASQAEELRQRIQREGLYYGITAQVRRGEQGSSVVATVWDGTEEVHVNEGEWVRYFTDVKAILD